MSWFYSNQVGALQPDGSVQFRFQASGMLALAWHLFTRSDWLEPIAPSRLKALKVADFRTPCGPTWPIADQA